LPASVLIYVPAFGGQVTATTFKSVAKLMLTLQGKGMGVGLTSHSFPDIEQLRNMALSLWYDTQPDFSHLLFVDADMGFEPALVLDMLLFDKPMVGGIYPKRSLPIEWAASAIGNGGAAETRGGFMQVGGLGMGCFLIRRDAIATMLEKMPHLVDTRVNNMGIGGIVKAAGGKRMIRAFDKIDHPELGETSEDLSFCQRYRECGGEVWGAMHHKMVHTGPHDYSGCYAEEIIKMAATAPSGEPIVQGKRGRFIVNPNDTFIGRSLLEYGEWCDFELQTMQPHIPERGVVLDVGANIGTHTVAFADMVGKHGQVYAFEPQPRLFKRLTDNVVLNRLENVQASRAIVMDRNAGILHLTPLPDDVAAFNFGAVPAVGGGEDTAPSDCIDSMNLEKCSLIKIDVEGMEAQVIRGARETITRCRPVLYIENNGDDSEALWGELEALDYEAFWSIGPYFNPNNYLKNKRDIWPGTMLSVNVIAFPRDMAAVLGVGMRPLMGPDDSWRRVTSQAAE